MKIGQLAHKLCGRDWKSIQPPPWSECKEGYDAIHAAWAKVQQLIAQRNGLTKLFPDKAEAHKNQCNELIAEVARTLHEKVWELEA